MAQGPKSKLGIGASVAIQTALDILVQWRSSPQPEQDAGEWQVHNDGSVRICLVLPDGGCKQVAEAEIIGWTREEAVAHAAQIISDHRSAAAVPKLVELLENARNAINGGLSLRRQIDCSCKGSKEYTCINCRLVDRLSSARAKINEALTTVNQTGGGG